ncbi:MAG: hypothetical protein IJW55_04825 [Clostridia bacterium]|nr:hypothetical protein [Clostridia bacterium]
MDNHMDALNVLINKINLFMKNNILHTINPNKIYWWFSLSGGKDSYTMALAVYLWYQKYNYVFLGEGFFIKQWSDNDDKIYKHLCNNIYWMPVIMVDGITKTNDYTCYRPGEQAPCANCSKVRKEMGDQYILEHLKKGYYNIIARGLHLTDMAISYLWRIFWRINITNFAETLEKGNPFEKLALENDIYLAKPLCYVREFECEQFSKLFQYKPICCGCPACRYPSRRDIVEETLRLFFKDELWEFNVKGIDIYLNRTNASCIKEISLKGRERKCSHLTLEFADYSLKYWKANEKKSLVDKLNFNSTNFLDNIGCNFLVKSNLYHIDDFFLPKFFSEAPLYVEEKMMIATVGPFWGAIGYHNLSKRNYAFQLQEKIYGIKIDQLWSQVTPILQSFYKEKEVFNYENGKENYFIFDCTCNSTGNNNNRNSN